MLIKMLVVVKVGLVDRGSIVVRNRVAFFGKELGQRSGFLGGSGSSIRVWYSQIYKYIKYTVGDSCTIYLNPRMYWI
jgi:hypothetical protein